MKLTFKKSTAVAVVVLLGLLSLTVIAVEAQIVWPWSSEPGFEPQALTTQHEGGELQPDDNGYTGAIIEANQAVIAPSGDQPEEEVNWDALIPEGDPDTIETNAEPNWSGFYYYHATGSALRPRDSAVEWNSSGTGGCLYQVSGNANVIYNLHLDIPDGARIDPISSLNDQHWHVAGFHHRHVRVHHANPARPSAWPVAETVTAPLVRYCGVQE